MKNCPTLFGALVDLLEMLNQKYFLSSRLTIILDNARYHYSAEVRDYLSNNKRINLVFLPAYSPELNLIERVWKFFKKKVLYNQYYRTLQDFREAAQNFFRNIGQYKQELASLLSGGLEGFN
jgi:transposase